MKINCENNENIKWYINAYKSYIDWYRKTTGTYTEYIFEDSKDGIPVYLKDDIENIQKESSDVIFIDNTCENINSRVYFKHYPKNKHYIILSNGNWNPAYYPMPIEYTLLTRHMYFYEYTKYLIDPHSLLFHSNKKYEFLYPKKINFVSTVGTLRKERDDFFKFFLDNYKSKNFIAKYSGDDLGINSSQFDTEKVIPGEFDSYTLIDGLEDYYYSVSASLPIDMYNQAYYKLVIEGEIDYVEQFHPTEKIVKALLTGIPFVVVSHHLFLKNLQKLGFKTYESIWSESYDQEPDVNKRTSMITDLCNQLLNFNWEEHKPQLQEIAQHNRECFLNLNKFFEKEAQDTIFKIRKFTNERRCRH